MRKTYYIGLLTLILTTIVISPVLASPSWDRYPKGFEHGLAVSIDGNDYYFKGPGSIAGAIDVPGHVWVQTGPNRVIGLHYNVGPWAVPHGTPWWATGEPYGVLLFKVDGIIDVPPDDLSSKMENWYRKHGYVHIHEFVDEYGVELEDYVVYLKHTAVRTFFFDGGPMTPMYWVYPGVDYDFMPNW
jgi:hypothetical protein